VGAASGMLGRWCARGRHGTDSAYLRSTADLAPVSAPSFLSPMSPHPPGVPRAETMIDVRSSELDAFGHVNHAVFLNYLEHGRFEALEQAGFPWSVLNDRNWGIFVVRIEVDYVAEAKRGDALIVRTWADSFRRTSMILEQEIVHRDDPSVVTTRARVTAVWVGPDRKPMRVPSEVRVGLTGAES
jgi:YbgC/YbaW family acyl-CoA thioester hydrolase